MKLIKDWFEAGAPFEEGVQLYLSLPHTKADVCRRLKRGKTSYNKALLIKELRQAKKQHTTNALKKTKSHKKQPNTRLHKSTAPTTTITDKVIATEHQNKLLKEESQKQVFGGVKYNELPTELKLRYREAKDIFYNLCDLKIALNDVPEASVKEALAIQLNIEELDEQRILIWKELEHWQNHKTLLPTIAEDFTQLSPGVLVRKKANYASNITKQTKRINEWWEELVETSNKSLQIKLERKIAKGEKAIHQHKLNINKIDELLS